MEFAASLIAVIGLANEVTSRCRRYLSAVNDYHDDLARILAETTSMRSIVASIETRCRQRKNSDYVRLEAALGGDGGSIGSCLSVLRALQDLLPEFHQEVLGSKRRKGLQSAVDRLAWPLRESRARSLLSQLGSIKSTINLAITVEISSAIEQRDNIITNRHSKRERLEILEWLSASNPSASQNSASAIRDASTGFWLLESPEYTDWKLGSTSFLWISGIPGSGKTVLFSQIVEDIQAYCRIPSEIPNVYSYYYCHFGKVEDDTEELLRWVISHLSRQVQFVPEEVSEAYEHGLRPSVSAMTSALRSIMKHGRSVYLLVDGLDESKSREKLLGLLETLREPTLVDLRVLVTSRDDANNRDEVAPYAKSISLSNSYVDEDIMAYVGRQLGRSKRLSRYPIEVTTDIEQALLKGAQGMFRWVACQLDILTKLHSVAEVRFAIRNLPNGLDATYQRILSNIPRACWPQARRALRLVCSSNGATFSDPVLLAEAMIVDIDSQKLDTSARMVDPRASISDICAGLIKEETPQKERPGSVRFELSHSSVQEYLLSERITSTEVGYFHMSTESAEHENWATLATYLLCIPYDDLLVVKLGDYDQPKDQISSALEEANEAYPLAPAAFSQLLDGHEIKSATSLAAVDKRLLRLFDPSQTSNKWLTWRALILDADETSFHPFWKVEPGLELNIMLGLACLFRRHSLISNALDQSPNLVRHSGQVEVEPRYSSTWAKKWEEAHTDDDDDPEIWLPQGSPLHVALAFDCVKAVEFFLENLDETTLRKLDGQRTVSLLSVALRTGHYQSTFTGNDTHSRCLAHRYLELLLGAGVSPNEPAGLDGISSSSTVKTTASSEATIAAATEVPWGLSETPLQTAARLGDRHAIELLLDAGADPNAVGSDRSAVRRIQSICTGRSEDPAEALHMRGLRHFYKTPLRLLLEVADDLSAEYDDGGGTGELEELDIAIDLLAGRGGLSLCLFPNESLPGYESRDWDELEESLRRVRRRMHNTDGR